MDFKEVKELIEIINTSSISFFEITTEKGHIKMDKSLNREISVPNSKEEKTVVVSPAKAPITEVSTETSTEITLPKEVEDNSLVKITSPMVGTFYSGVSPDSPSFVKEGDNINIGDTLCIIEAMKLMNEIESDVKGVIKKVLVKAGDMVEYGQTLFEIKEV